MKSILGSNSFLIPLIFVVLLFSTNSYANATISDSMKIELQKVSDKMYREGNSGGNNNFMVVDAVIYGLLPLDVSYNFTYAYGKISINGHEIPDTFTNIYSSKINCLSAYNYGKFTSSINSDSLTLAKIFDSTSSFRKLHVNKQHKPNSQTVLDLLAKDKIIDTNNDNIIVYNKYGFYVNYKCLDKQIANKYETFINMQGYCPIYQYDQLYIEQHNQKNRQ